MVFSACAVTSLRSTRSATAGAARHLLHRLALLGRRPVSCFVAMSFALLYAALRFLLDALLISRRSESRLQADVLALRHQLRVLQRQVRRPRWQPADRLFLSALSRLLPSPSWSSLLPSPETLLRWHRELGRRRWAAYRSRPRRPQPTDRRARRAGCAVNSLAIQLPWSQGCGGFSGSRQLRQRFHAFPWRADSCHNRDEGAPG